jgi:hypothetical protein
MVSSFLRCAPEDSSATLSGRASAAALAGTAWSTKRYLNVELLKEQNIRGAITAE